MMRLPKFRYFAPRTIGEAASIVRDEGPETKVVAGGTDLFPNMKRRHQMPATLVGLRRVAGLSEVRARAGGALSVGAGATLTDLERNSAIAGGYRGLHESIRSISTPILRNMGTIGGNVCLDTRCNYYNQNYEWRRAINFCMKCDGDTCWVAPSSSRCWAVQSSDSVPVWIALGAEATLVGPDGERRIPVG